MLNGADISLGERLKQAEDAEREVSRLQPLASEAPQLRDEVARSRKAAERQQAKDAAMARAAEAVNTASAKQATVPELLGNAARAVNKLYSTLVEIEGRRQDAMQSLAVADRLDYEMELAEGEEHERSMDRDARGLAYVLASRHGDARVEKLMEELQPSFELLGGCNLDEPVYRDVANFVMERVTLAKPPTTAGNNRPAARRNHVEPPQERPAEEPSESPSLIGILAGHEED